MRSDLDVLADIDGLSIAPLSPWITVVALLLSLVIGAGLLMLVVRWSEGFTMRFAAALKITVLTLVAGALLQFVVFFALLGVGLTGMSAYWTALLVMLVLSCVAFVFIYAYGIKQPDGSTIGLERAVKVTLIQLGIGIALIVAIAFLVAILIVSGVVNISQLTAN